MLLLNSKVEMAKGMSKDDVERQLQSANKRIAVILKQIQDLEYSPESGIGN